jgi:uncharacterized membrane protein
MQAISFALIAFVGWGVGDIFGGLVARKTNGYSSAVLNYIFCIVFASFYIPFALPELKSMTLGTGLWLMVLLPIGIIPLVTLYEGISRGNASLVGTVAGSFGALVSILSVLFLGESLNIFQVFCIVIVLVGIILSSINLKNINFHELLSDKGLPFALVSLVTWGIYFTFVKIPIRQVGWFWPAYISWWGFPIVLLYLRQKSIKISTPRDKKHIIFVILNSLVSIMALFCFNLAAAKGQSSIIAPIASSYPALFALLAYFVFKDRLTKQQILGMVTTLVGIISLSLLA